MVTSQDAGSVARCETAVERVVDAVADRTGTDPLDLPPLYDAVDTDALAAVVESARAAEISFFYCGRDVVVAADDDVTVDVGEA